MANQSNKAPPYPKVKYSDAKFRDIIPTLPLQECLLVEYKAKGIWFKMISKQGNFRYNCECCGVDNVGPTPILDHLRGKKHRLALQVADKLYHPEYTAPRPTSEPARTPMLDAFMDREGLKRDKIPDSKAKPGPASAQRKAKPGPASAQKPKPEGSAAAQANNSSNQKPGPASSKKQPVNANNNKTAASEKAEKEAKSKPGPASAKSNETTSSAAATTDVKSNSNSNEVKPTEKAAETVKPNNSTVQTNKTSNDVKSENALKPNTSVQVDPEIVVLDDDDDEEDVSKKVPTPVNKPAIQVPKGQAITVTDGSIPKGQRPQKRNMNAQGHNKQVGENISAGDRVINPAAVLAQSVDQNEGNKPQYQQNRVIIPSANRKRPSKDNDPSAGQQPNFSKKVFTTNVSATDECEGIIGVEYVVKILKVYNDPEPFYECCLCEVVMDGVGMQSHLLGYNHRYKYLEKHFPTCFNQYRSHIGNIQVMSFILDRIAKAIESHHGRELPYECLSGEFRANRHGVMTTVYSFRHTSEYSGPSFTNVVDAKQIDELYKNRINYNPPKPDPKRKPTFDTRNGQPAAKKGRMERAQPPRGGVNGRGPEMEVAPPGRRPYRMENVPQNTTVDDATHKLLVEEFLNNTRGKSRSPGGRRRRHRSRSRSPHRSHRRRSVSPLRDGDIWQAYRHLVDRSRDELDQMYKEYRKDPEKHPIYDEEWRKFWKNRKDQLSREGLDHRNYDFQPEWVRYFAVRIEELYDEAIEDIKISSRRRLILPMSNDQLKDKKYHVKSSGVSMEDQQRKEQQNKEMLPPRPDNKISVVSVLRLLTALEDYLGSLGPKIVDLLSRALLVEKTNPREVNEIILNLENCTILETAMEKLKGVLIAGLLEGPKVRAFNNVITETDKILRIAYKMRQDNPSQMGPRNPQSNFPQKTFSPQIQQNTNIVSGGGVGVGVGVVGGTNTAASAGAAANLLSQIDKKELATKLAAALTAQGKTDFNPEQLQQLIAVYSLIDKKKRDSAVTTDKSQKMTLSDTLTALLNPAAGGKSGSDAPGNMPLHSNRSGAAVAVGGGGGGGARGEHFSNTNDKFGSMSNTSINNFVSMLNNRDNHPGGGSSNRGDSEMWQNLQNIQSSLRLQNNPQNAGGGGFGNNAANVARGYGNNASMGGGGMNYNNRGGGGFGGQPGNDFNSEQNFNRSVGMSGGNRTLDDFEAGFRSGNNMARQAANDDIGGGRAGGGGGVGGGPGNNSGNNYMGRTLTGTGANNTLGFSRNSFLGGGGGSNNFSGLSNFSTSITPGPMKSNFQRSSLGGGMGAGGGMSNFGGGGSNFNNQQNKSNPAGGSAPNQRNQPAGGGAGRSNIGSNWRNQ